MDIGSLLSAVQTLLATLQCSELKDLCSILGYKSELDSLKRTVDTVKAVLHDAGSVQDNVGLLTQARLYIDELKDVVYDAEDLLDEFVTLAEQKKLIKNDGNVSQKVLRLISSFNSLGVSYKMSRGVKEIRKRLDAIISNHNNLGFKFDCHPIRKRRDTCSYVYTPDIIGRKDDVENIVRKLLDPNVQQDISCLTIVGIGGLGKTALAQLVYNDQRIEKEFPFRWWTCVSDQDQERLDVRAILSRILQLITPGNHNDLELEPLQKQLREQLLGKKFFLVLDDLWNEDRLQWLNLERFLISGLRGSWIVVTTRSEKTATAVGDNHPYKLKGLLDEDSWHLFEITAFGQRDKQAYSSDLIEVGQEIVKRCANVPLAIKMVGSLLYGQGKEKWISLQKMGLGRLKSGKDGGIEPILKLSYNHLEPTLKTCFCYCALFPKDHVIKKEMLINLWMAQDYITPLQEGQSIEDAGEEYFSILVKRCFFQDVKNDEYGNIVSCKIHDLMHDIAQEVAGKEVCTTKSLSMSLDNRTRHLSYGSIHGGTENCFPKTKIRTCLHIGQGLFVKSDMSLDMLLRNWTCLRTLDLSRLSFKSMPRALGKLIHLRYLDLSENSELQRLPRSIGKMVNLQTLNLRWCRSLEKLPKDLLNLIRLRVLDIDRCCVLNNMPLGIGKLSCLQKLPMFALGDRNSIVKQSVSDQMEDLKGLINLKGSLSIMILPHSKLAEGDVTERGCIRNKEYLSRVDVMFSWDRMVNCYEDELLLQDLQPHYNLKELNLDAYNGMRMPSWAREDHLATFLPNLVKVKIASCHGLQHLASLGKLRHLKSVQVEGMNDLEYIESTCSKGIISDRAEASGSETFFPSLKHLRLIFLPKLKRWWRGDNITESDSGQEHRRLPSFPSLSKLEIFNCPELTCMPTCPALEELHVVGKLNEKLRIMNAIESGNYKLRKVRSYNAKHLQWVLPMEAFRCLHEMRIEWDKEIESFSEVEDVFRSCSSSLRHLEIGSCDKLKSVCGGLEHLTGLEELHLWNLPNLNPSNGGEREGEDDDGMPWRCLHQNLHSLTLGNLPKMVNIPDWMRYLTSLQSLIILDREELESLPASMQQLTSLRTLRIWGCSEGLLKRCQDHTGQDWPNIQHIRNRDIMQGWW